MELLRLVRKPQVTVTPEVTIMHAINVMIEHQAGAAAVVMDGKLVGIFTERDVMTKIVARNLDPNTTQISKVMATDIKKIVRNGTVAQAIKIMSEHRIRHIPLVAEDNEFLGMISLRFLLHDRLDDLVDQLQSMDAYMTADGPGG